MGIGGGEKIIRIREKDREKEGRKKGRERDIRGQIQKE